MPWQLFARLFPDETHHEVGLHEEIHRLLPTNGRLLDLGCGRNAHLGRYVHPGREAWGADFTRHPHLERGERFRLLHSDGTIPFPDDHFDLVCAVMVLEHVRHPQRFLSEAARVLRPGGHLVAHTIHGWHYVTWIRRLLGLLPHTITQELVWRLYRRPDIDTFPTCYRLNSERALRRAAQGSGLTLLRLRRYADPGYFRFLPLTLRMAMCLDRALEWLIPGLGRLYFTAVLGKTVARQHTPSVPEPVRGEEPCRLEV